MMMYALPGFCGFLLGLLLHWTRLNRADGLRDALGLRRSHALRSALYTPGCAMALTALLCYLAVIDVDKIVVYPLHLGVIVGGVLFGAAAGLSGFTPETAFAGGGSNRPVEALCVMAGAFAVTMLPLPENPLQTMAPLSDTTLFRVTLDEPFLFGGGFLGQACLGLLLMTMAACIPSNRVILIPDEEIAAHAAGIEEAAEAEEAVDTAAAEEAASPQDAAEDTFVAALPGEEPLVVDTAAVDAEESAEEAEEESAEEELIEEESGDSARENAKSPK